MLYEVITRAQELVDFMRAHAHQMNYRVPGARVEDDSHFNLPEIISGARGMKAESIILV